MNRQYDILIIGGGMAGASLAIALSGHGLRLGLVEAAPLEVDAVPNYDDRGIALSYGSRRIFSALGVWSAMHGQAQPIEHIHVSEQGGFGFTHLHADEEKVPALGYVITARDLGAGLLPALESLDDLDIIAPARVQWARVEADRARIGLEEGELQARLLVAADGGHSLVRQQLGFETRRREYHQSAITANITPGQPHGNAAWERFTANGPMALLPMTESRCALVWTVADEEVGEVLSLNDRQFLDRVQRNFGWRLGRLQQVGKRASYPLSQLWVPDTVQQRAVVIGNAAHTLHPVAGQGFNLGLRDVAALAEVVLNAWRQEQDPADLDSLTRYQQWRQRDQRGVVEATNLLVRSFSNDFLPVKLARNLGVLGLEALPPARHAIARAAMGLHGRLPRLSRGLPL
ncbi:2-octaprenyl-6-methoxyphenyl hydroxylase [Thiolapillus brandeum]|uniref:2-octaprenyl-6-methoxyphenol hydroxylase n=1 Tax=Thiolapillus brandeum TaxID=1076588 RepID=A0A7U6JFU6_9GAMM|nr:2-octaprenyl-6-methoxyphenyl hydroxylase [Thiolapillus brandeum]BAO43086.1 2-octaprenyl-6-methoxyphenol hydroxylase [Thiolapillus brandeum]